MLGSGTSSEARMYRPLLFAALVVGCATAVYLEYGADFRTPRSSLPMRGALVTHNKPVTERFAGAVAALKAKYGSDVEVRQTPSYFIVQRNGQYVASQTPPSVFHEALGMTQVRADGVIRTFPFHVSPYELHHSILPRVVPMLKMSVGRVFEGDNPDFGLDDFSIEQCRMLSPAELGLGLERRLLRLGNSAICTSVWKRPPVRRMLVGIVVADGGSWVRLFARGACRILSNAWLKSNRRTSATQPDYLECLLVDRPDNQPFGSGVSAFAYEVRKDGSLATFWQDPGVLRTAPLPINPNLPTFRRAEDRDTR